MKKILKRLGIFGLLLAVLIPFLDLPVVKAATSGCPTGMNVYLFLDTFNGNSVNAYDNGGHKNYAVFEDAFPENARVTGISKVTFSNTNTEYENFYKLYEELSLASTDSETKKQIQDKGNNISFTDFAGVDNVTFLIHGAWAEESSGADSDSQFRTFTKAKFNIKEKIGNYQNLKSASIQNLVNTNALGTDLGLAKMLTSGTAAALDTQTFGSNFVNSINNNILADRESAITNKYMRVDSTDGNEMIFAIERQINDYSNIHIGKYDTSSEKYLIYSSETGSISNSYDTFINCRNGSPECTYYESDDANDVNIFVDNYNNPIVNNAKIPYYWPEEYKVTYEVCDTTSTNVSLVYDGNTDDTTLDKVPASQSYDSGEEVTIQAGATRNNYAFKKWCTEKDGTGTCYVENDKFNITKDTTLYAQWGKEGTTDPSKTGIVSYILGFASVGIVSSGIYLISKKKNLFKQI